MGKGLSGRSYSSHYGDTESARRSSVETVPGMRIANPFGSCASLKRNFCYDFDEISRFVVINPRSKTCNAYQSNGRSVWDGTDAQ